MSNSTPQELKTYQDDDIDLFQLFETFWRGKILIILISLLFLAVGAGYAFYTTPVYESRAYLLPPAEKGVVELNKLKLLSTSLSSINDYTSQSVYLVFLERLNSNHAKQQFLEQKDVNAYFMDRSSNQLQAWQLFNKALSVNTPETIEAINADVSIKTDSAKLSASFTNSYINLALDLTRKQIIDDIKEKTTAHLNQLELMISNSYIRYQSQIDAELEKLREALHVAEAVKLQEPFIADTIIEQQNAMMVDEIRRLYRYGANALEAEISVMELRRDNKLLISGYAQLLQQKALIESLNIDSTKIQPAQIDLAAQVNNRPIAPKKALILALSLILGLMTGLMVVLIRSAIGNRKTQ